VADVLDDDVVTLPEYQGLLADARSMVVALLEADVTRRPVREGDPPLSQSEIEQFGYWRDKAVKNWNLIYQSLQAADPVMVRHGLDRLRSEVSYPLNDLRSDWEELAPEWAAAYRAFSDHLRRLQDKTAVSDQPAARDQVAAFLPTLVAELRPIDPR